MEFNWDNHIKNLGELPPFDRSWMYELTHIIQKNIPSDDYKILEVGTSKGGWLRWFESKYSCDAVGLDINPSGFKPGDVVKFVSGDGLALPFKDKSFNIVFSTGVVEHFKRKNREYLISEKTRVLSRDGYLICTIPNLNFSLQFFHTKIIMDLSRGYKHYRTTKDELEALLKKFGFEIVYSGFLGWYFEKGKILRYLRFPKFLVKKKFFSHKLTSDEYLIIGRKK